MNIEAVLLAGGASTRMGHDKAKILVGGVPQALRMARLLGEACRPITVLGGEPVEGCAHLPDVEAHQGPMAALARFEPAKPLVFVASCDLVRFDPRLIPAFQVLMGNALAVLPEVDGMVQPLCGLYAAAALESLRTAFEGGQHRIFAWARQIEPVVVTPDDLIAAGIHPDSVRGANTPEQLRALLDEAPQ